MPCARASPAAPSARAALASRAAQQAARARCGGLRRMAAGGEDVLMVTPHEGAVLAANPSAPMRLVTHPEGGFRAPPGVGPQPTRRTRAAWALSNRRPPPTPNPIATSVPPNPRTPLSRAHGTAP